jgi:Trypsin-like peptidase domain/Tetratricopeptide repeat
VSRFHGGLLALLVSTGMGAGTPSLLAQKADTAARSSDKPGPKTALPLWTKPDSRAREDLGRTTRSHSRAVLLVGYPGVGFGTAWVLSAKHRLLVTNAHVADIMGTRGKMLAIVNGTDQVHKVKRAWYHPGVRRMLPSGKFSIRAECPADGDVDAWSPDVAVLELTPDGPALPAELAMATPDEVKNLFAQTVGMLGFPAHSTGKPEGPRREVRGSWPALGEKAEGTYHDGVVSRLTNFRLSVNAPPEELQFVQSTLGNWPGFSGSPVYLSNGHVVAINNSWRDAEARGVKTKISQAIRVDCLWELLVHHGLDARVSVPVAKSQLRIKRWLELSEPERQFRQAVQLVQEAANLIDSQGESLAGVRKCTAALALVPDYPDAYRVRCAGRNRYYCDENPSRTAARALLDAAASDARKYAELMPSDPRGITAVVNTASNMAALMKNSSRLRLALPLLDKALSSGSLPKPQRAEFHSLRGVCHFNLGNRDRARDDFDVSIRLDPENDVLLENRARFWDALGRRGLADADREQARAIRRRMLERLREKD